MDILEILHKAQEVIGMVVMILSGAVGIAMLIPGEHPDKELQAAIDFLKRFSRK
jgi:glutaminase